MNALQLCADSFHTKKLCSRVSSSEVQFFTQIGRFAFLRPPLGDLGATYDDHLRLIKKRVVDFLLALEMCMGSHGSGIPWVPWDSHGNGNKISHGNVNGMGMGTKCMGMGIKTWEWGKNSHRNTVLN